MPKLAMRSSGVSGECLMAEPVCTYLTHGVSSTVARDGDEIFLVSVMENEAKGTIWWLRLILNQR